MKSKTSQEFKETEIGKISTEFEVMKLGQMLKLLKDGSHNPPKRVPEGIPFIAGATEITYFDIDFSKATYITKKEYDKIHKNFEVIENDILLTIVGTVGNVAIAKKSDLPFSLQRNIAILRPNEHLHYLYLFYWLSSPLFKNILYAWGNRTAQPRFYLGQISDTPIVIPPFKTQKKISSFLLLIDLKLKNLQKQNKILEQIAQTIFKSWFVDFDGVTEFEDSELGKIPKGWKVEKLNEFCTSIQNGGTPKRKEHEYWKNGIIDWYKTGELHDNFLLESEEKITETGLKNSSVHLWPKNTILLAIYAFPVVGRMGILTKPGCSNQAASGLIPKNEIGTYFLFLSLIFTRESLGRIATGAAQQNISQEVLKKHTLILPPIEIISKFNEKITSIFEQVKTNQTLIQSLIHTRDSLLPKLISGEIRV